MPLEKTLLGVTYKNSEMPADALINAYGVQLFRAAAESLRRVEAAALKEGFDFRITSGYRNVGSKGDLIKYKKGELTKATQWALWEGWNRGLNDIIVDIKTQLNIPIGPEAGFNEAADPNKGSNHGFGIAIDIYGKNPKSNKIVATWVKKNSTKKGIKESFINLEGLKKDPILKDQLSEKQDAFQEWFVQNGPSYGWTWAGKEFTKIEPWHFEYDPNTDSFIKKSNPIPLLTPNQINNITKNNQTRINDYRLNTYLTNRCYRNTQ